jgi:hypothetical protein
MENDLPVSKKPASTTLAINEARARAVGLDSRLQTLGLRLSDLDRYLPFLPVVGHAHPFMAAGVPLKLPRRSAPDPLEYDHVL